MRCLFLTTFVSLAACFSPCTEAVTLDFGFNTTGDARDYLDYGSSFTDLFADAAIAPGSGALYSVGRSEYVSAGGATHGVLFKRFANGQRDMTFHDGAGNTSRVILKAERAGASSSLDAVAFDGSGTGAVLAAGYNDLNNGKRCGVVYKVLDHAVVKGLLDGGFGTAGRFSYCAADASAITFSDIKVLSNGRVLVTGNGTLPSGERNGFLLRLTAAGQLDTTFNAGSIRGTPGRVDFDVRAGKDDTALRIAVGSQGYYIGGNAKWSRVANHPFASDDIDVWVSRVTSAGLMDSNFSASGIRVYAPDKPGTDKTDLLADLAIDSSGRPLLLLNINPAQLVYDMWGEIDTTRTGASRAAIMRLMTNGLVDFGYGNDPSGYAELSRASSWNCVEFCDYDEPRALVVTPANEVWVSGRFVPADFWSPSPRHSLMTMTHVGSNGVVASAETRTDWLRSEGTTILQQADGKLVVGGLVRTTDTPSDTDFVLARFMTQ